jgi:hypothetical protein
VRTNTGLNAGCHSYKRVVNSLSKIENADLIPQQLVKEMFFLVTGQLSYRFIEKTVMVETHHARKRDFCMLHQY